MNSRVMVVEWPDGLRAGTPEWAEIEHEVGIQRPDLLVTNEMPFGAWAPIDSRFDAGTAAEWAKLHEDSLTALSSLSAGAVVSTRPIFNGTRLVNEAFSIVGGNYAALHQKHYFPEEPGWFEFSWFQNEMPGYKVHDIEGIRLGFLLCTELMFNEHARFLGRAGAELLVVPRATGVDTGPWEIAAKMAQLASGCYVATSNRSGQAHPGSPRFGGLGFIVGPDTRLLARTTPTDRCVTERLDLEAARAAKLGYPRYVKERHE